MFCEQQVTRSFSHCFLRTASLWFLTFIFYCSSMSRWVNKREKLHGTVRGLRDSDVCPRTMAASVQPLFLAHSWHSCPFESCCRLQAEPQLTCFRILTRELLLPLGRCGATWKRDSIDTPSLTCFPFLKIKFTGTV